MPKLIRDKTKIQFAVFAGLGLIGIGFASGWVANTTFAPISQSAKDAKLAALRLDGYKFISPLLACDTIDDIGSDATRRLEEKLTALTNEEKNLGHIDTVSVYFRNYKGGDSLHINPQEKYYPASLNKIPILIAAYKTAETDPEFLNKKVVFTDNDDTNASQEIKPKEFVQKGKSYTIGEAVKLMIKYSDNNALFLLSKQIDPKLFESTYKDLKIPLRQDPNAPEDYLTAKDFSYFLRVLYNSTYLKRDLSEKALALLNEADFKDGIVAGVPTSTSVSHKFGLKSNFDNGVTKSRELHDCGIVYNSESPYLLCVMTKSSSSLEDTKSVIKKISALVYEEVGSNK